MLVRSFSILALVATAACTNTLNKELSPGDGGDSFGNATMNNSLIQSGQKDYAMALGGRFAQEVPSTITFAFGSAQLTSTARAALDRQATWINQFPEVRFNVFGHTDAVGSESANKALGLARANAVVSYLGARGVSRSRLQALVSYGESRPVIHTNGPEEQNRRTVTEVSGFVQSNPTVLNGKFAQVVMREYIETIAPRPHPKNAVVQTSNNEPAN